ncbi:MAG: hypothetical protein ABJF67_05145, partial [Aurantimonas coralicida]
MTQANDAGGLPDTRERWAAFFGGFARVVLVANSDAVDIAALSARYGDGTLFVFFNKVFKVLDAPFDRPSLLIARSSQAGANIVYRREVGTVLQLLRGPQFHGIANLKAGAAETFSPAESFENAPVGFLDLAPVLLPPTGLAIGDRAADLLHLRPGDLARVEFLDGERRTIDVPVTQIIQSYIGLVVFMDIDALARLQGTGPRISGVHLLVDD